jgi:hypothetical protein
MSIFQSLIALVALIVALSVIVQAVQEFIKKLLGTKAAVMAQTMEKFMGSHLTIDQVQKALKVRGLDLTALENFKVQDFRQLLDGIPFGQDQIQGVVVSAENTLERFKDNIAASYDAAMAAFQKAYTAKNKWFAVGLSLATVAVLNANLIILYENVSADPGAQQAIVSKILAPNPDGSGQSQQDDLPTAYKNAQTKITQALQSAPILVRTGKYGDDFAAGWLREIVGLLLMGLAVSLGAPFWNDVLKGMMGVNNALNGSGNGKKT